MGVTLVWTSTRIGSVRSCVTGWYVHHELAFHRRSPARSNDRAGHPTALPRVETRSTAALQPHHAHPEHEFVADLDVVLAHERELAVVADAQHGQAGGQRPYRVAVFDVHRQI